MPASKYYSGEQHLPAIKLPHLNSKQSHVNIGNESTEKTNFLLDFMSVARLQKPVF
jgi:hypothetical protein